MASVANPYRPPPPTLAQVPDPEGDGNYPRQVLEGCKSALVLFSAAWHGKQDAYWVAEAGLVGTCVDVDRQRLKDMRGLYPDGWQFAEADAFEYAERSRLEGDQWDVVSLDPFSNLMDRCADELPLWCSIAGRAVILGTGTYTVVDAPAGWSVTDTRKRSEFRGGVYWTVLEPA